MAAMVVTGLEDQVGTKFNLGQTIKINLASICGLIFILLVFHSTSIAQIYFSTSVNSYFDDNIFNNFQRESDFVNTFSGEFGYDIETESNNFELYYIGSFNRFGTHPDKSAQFHKVGLVNTYLFSEDENPFNAGINYSTKINREGYYIYDYNRLSLYANYLHSLSATDRIQIGVIGNRIVYQNFSLFSHYQLKGFIRSINGFESRTSIIAGAELDEKLYLDKFEETEVVDHILQAKLHLQLGQGITDNFGISAYVFLRKNIEGGNRYFNSDDFVYYEEEIFNDVYSNEGTETGLSFSYLISPVILAKVAGKYEIRNYTDLPAASEDGSDLNELRSDKQVSLGAFIEFGLSSILNGLSLSVSYNYISSSSNDYYYDYENNIYSITLGFDF
jgi:hypothetical protein